ncbi:hypothetical protein [Paraferrimonas haliotis]|nr:hypothetical protein [Paraferrimonas haliotis]
MNWFSDLFPKHVPRNQDDIEREHDNQLLREQKELDCNYSDDYYGDQVCQLIDKKGRTPNR